MSATSALGKIGKEAVPALRAALADTDRLARHAAVVALGEVGREAVPALVEALKQEDKGTRLAALSALGNLGAQAEAAVPELVTALKEWDDLVERQLVPKALGQIGPAAKEAVVPLVRAMQEPRNRNGTPGVFADALARIGKDAVPALAEALRTQDAYTRRWTAHPWGRAHAGPAGLRAGRAGRQGGGPGRRGAAERQQCGSPPTRHYGESTPRPRRDRETLIDAPPETY